MTIKKFRPSKSSIGELIRKDYHVILNLEEVDSMISNSEGMNAKHDNSSANQFKDFLVSIQDKYQNKLSIYSTTNIDINSSEKASGDKTANSKVKLNDALIDRLVKNRTDCKYISQIEPTQFTHLFRTIMNDKLRNLNEQEKQTLNTF